ncbi:MAG TPA: stalk domain-containing protein [Syntrophomonadaceae bacterium]|nr:stalk domain-containing protein [Syntrophomonadaceae bacterium]
MFRNSFRPSLKRGVLFVLLTVLIGWGNPQSVSAGNIKVVLNGETIVFPDQQPYLSASSRTMVPVRFVAETFQAQMTWYDAAKVLKIEMGDPIVIMQAGSRESAINGKSVQIDSPPELINDRVCVPLRFLSEAMKLSVVWHAETNTVEINGAPSGTEEDQSTINEASAVYLEQLLNQKPPAGQNIPDLGPNASLNRYHLFPEDNPWNQRIDGLPADPNSTRILQRIGFDKGLKADFGANWDGGPFGIPYVVIDNSTPFVPITFDYGGESDPGPYPIPYNAPIEKGSDRHILVLNRDTQKLYETWDTTASGNGFAAGSGAIFDLMSNVLRPKYWTSADAAGLPILPGLVRYDEVYGQGLICHALRVTVDETRRAFVAPATHFASGNDDPYLPPMGTRIRLKKDYDISGYPPCVQVILQGLKTYGMYVADNGSSMFISGAPDARWNDDELSAIRRVKASDLEIVQMGPITADYE